MARSGRGHRAGAAGATARRRRGGKSRNDGWRERQPGKRRVSPRAKVDGRKGRRGRNGGKHININGGLLGKRPQCQKAAWMKRRLRGKQAPMGVTAFARAAHAKVTHAKAVMAESVTSERAAVAVAQTAGQGAAVALERAMEAETRAAKSVKNADDVAAEAVRYADRLWKQLGGQGPPFLAV